MRESLRRARPRSARLAPVPLEGAAADRDMAGRAWDLDEPGPGLRRAARPSTGPGSPTTARRAAAAGKRWSSACSLIHDYRLFPFRDPDLPPELLPEGWSGRAAHEVFLEAHGLLRAPAEGYVDGVLGALAQAS